MWYLITRVWVISFSLADTVGTVWGVIISWYCVRTVQQEDRPRSAHAINSTTLSDWRQWWYKSMDPSGEIPDYRLLAVFDYHTCLETLDKLTDCNMFTTLEDIQWPYLNSFLLYKLNSDTSVILIPQWSSTSNTSMLTFCSCASFCSSFFSCFSQALTSRRARVLTSAKDGHISWPVQVKCKPELCTVA